MVIWYTWIFIRRTDAETEVPILLLLDAKSRLVGKDPNAMKDWGQEEKGTTEDECGAAELFDVLCLVDI